MGELYRLDFASGKSYVGITRKTAAFRFEGHRYAASRSGKGTVYSAWRKYGEPKLTVLAIVQNDELNETEIRAVKVFGTLYPKGYNMTEGGDGAPSLSKVVALKISNALKGRKRSVEQIEKSRQARIGTKASDVARKNMSNAQKGKFVSEEARKNMAAAKIGTKAKIATRLKMSEAQRKRREKEGCTPQRWRYGDQLRGDHGAS